MSAYSYARRNSAQEGFVPVLIRADDETLLENICDVLELDYKTIRGRTKSDDGAADVVLADVPAEEDDAG